MNAIEWRDVILHVRQERVQVQACPLCGCLVIDREAHEESHRKD